LAADDTQSQIATAINDIAERTSLLVREEIELAKAEVSQKVSSLIRGVVIGLAAGIFAVIGLLFLLHGAAWVFFDFVFTTKVSYGYFIVAGVLFVLGGLAGFIAARAFKKSTPPTPAMAIDEAKLIKETFTAPSAAAEAERAGPTSATRPN
jgi:uncharacterized membrane protein YccC